MNEGVEVGFTNVHGPNAEGDRDDFWIEFENIQSWTASLWCLGGDFNIIRFPSERKKGKWIHKRYGGLFGLHP